MDIINRDELDNSKKKKFLDKVIPELNEILKNTNKNTLDIEFKYNSPEEIDEYLGPELIKAGYDYEIYTNLFGSKPHIRIFLR